MSATHYFTLRGVASDTAAAGGGKGGKGKGKGQNKPKKEVTPEVAAARKAVGEAAKAFQLLKKDKSASESDLATAEKAMNDAKAALAALGDAPAAKSKKGNKSAGKKKKDQPAKGKKKGKGAEAGQTRLGMEVEKSAANFAEWYKQVITKSEMIDFYDISGCYILRPWSYEVWEHIQAHMDAAFKTLGVKNCYFPIFVPESNLVKEKDHIEGFAPEVAWVTRAGQSDLIEPIAIRPTSETVMYPYFSKWISSHRELPLRLNQWCNVVRWEFKNPTPFIRTREFLWQEGHTAHATKDSAATEVVQILDIYARTYEELLAVPVIKGQKSAKEQFAGGLYTTTIEAFVPVNGRGIQAATSHCLGQNFANMFDIEFENEEGKSAKVWQNSWGYTTRSIGTMIMIHGDDKGLVMPPRVSPVQVVCVPILYKDKASEEVATLAESAFADLQAAGVRTHIDNRTNYNPGWKFNHWELKGVPIRLEVGPRDAAANSVTLVRRDTGEKETVAAVDATARCLELLEVIQSDMLAKATAERDSHIVKVENWNEFVPALDGKNMCLSPWCRTTECEEDIKVRSGSANDEGATGETVEGDEVFKAPSAGAKTLCMPFDQPEEGVAGKTCVGCGAPAKVWVLFGRSY